MDTIGCFKKACLCFCLKSMPVTQTDRNGNGRWRPEGGPGPRLSTAVCSSCFLLGLIRFLCWLRADRDVVMASVWLIKKKKNKQDQHVLHFPNKNTGKKQRLPSEHRCAQKWLCVLPWVTVYDGPGGWHGPRGSGRGPRGAGCPAHPERPWGGSVFTPAGQACCSCLPHSSTPQAWFPVLPTLGRRPREAWPGPWLSVECSGWS